MVDLPPFPPDYREAKAVFEAEYIRQILSRHGGNVSRAAKSMGMARRNLQIKIRKLGLRPALERPGDSGNGKAAGGVSRAN